MSDKLQELESLLLDPARAAERGALTVAGWATLVNEYGQLRAAAKREQAMARELFGAGRANLVFGEGSLQEPDPGPVQPGNFGLHADGAPDINPVPHSPEVLIFGGARHIDYGTMQATENGDERR